MAILDGAGNEIDCGCDVAFWGPDATTKILYCPIHAAAQKMYEALHFPGDTSVLLDLAANIIEVRGHEAHWGIAEQLRKKAILEREAQKLVEGIK